MATAHDTLPPMKAASQLVSQRAKGAAFAALLGAAFAGGALYAQAKQAPEEKSEIANVIERARERSDRLEEVQAALALRYHQELTEAEVPAPPPEPLGGKAAKQPPKKKVVEVASSGADGESEVATVEPIPAPPKKAEPEKKAEPAAAFEPERATSASTEDRLAKAFLDVMGDDAPPLVREKPVAKPSTVEPKATKTFSVQVGSFPSHESASALAAEYKRKGHTVHIASASVGGRQVHRVQLGAFQSRDDAVAYKRRVEDDEGVLSLVVSR